LNDEQMKVARELAGHSRFEWRPGMAAREVLLSGNWQPGDYRWRITSGAPDLAAVTSEHDIHEAPYMPSAFERAVPDLTDDATGGVLWAMAGRPHVVPVLRGVRCIDYGAGFTADTLAEACARLLLAQWAREVTP
jgi:hypothetical protein